MKLIRWCSVIASFSALLASSARADEPWWFDVEVIAFKRNVALSELEEQFTFADTLQAPRADADLIGDVISPDISWLKQGLAVCDLDTQPAWPAFPSLDIPSSDVDFLSLPPHVVSGNETDDIHEDEHSNVVADPYPVNDSALGSVSSATATSEVSSGDTVSEQVATFNDTQNQGPDALEYESALEYDSVLAYDGALALDQEKAIGPDAFAIAKYWLSFFGVNKGDVFSNENENTPSITVPEFTYCNVQKPWLNVESHYDSVTWKVDIPNNRLPAPSSLPIIIEGHDWPLASKAHLLTSNQQSLSSISRQIRSSRELERLFHLTWRQPVLFGKDNAFDVRLYGGKNYSSEFELSGEQRKDVTTIDENTAEISATQSSIDELFNNGLSPQTQPMENSDEPTVSALKDIFDDLEKRLANPTPIDYGEFEALDETVMSDASEDDASRNALRTPIWEIDGTMKVFLKYINRVPYLHIDSDMFYRQPVPENYFLGGDENELSLDESTTAHNVTYRLASVPLAEQRRVISTQLHYFDHPLFGFVVQIRRYKRPEDDSNAQ